MFDNKDYEIMMGSEVFKEFLKVKSAKDLKEEEDKKFKAFQDEQLETDELESALDDFDKFEDYLTTHPDVKDRLMKAKQVIKENPEVMDQVDPDFLRGLFMLALDEEESPMPKHPDAMDRLRAVSAKILEDIK